MSQGPKVKKVKKRRGNLGNDVAGLDAAQIAASDADLAASVRSLKRGRTSGALTPC
jgi:hypothetical protein